MASVTTAAPTPRRSGRPGARCAAEVHAHSGDVVARRNRRRPCLVIRWPGAKTELGSEERPSSEIPSSRRPRRGMRCLEAVLNQHRADVARDLLPTFCVLCRLYRDRMSEVQPGAYLCDECDARATPHPATR